jgi:hypothetical protein
VTDSSNVALTVDGVVDGTTQPAAGHVRITPSWNGSWALFRGPSGAGIRLRQRIASAPNEFQVRTRFGASCTYKHYDGSGGASGSAFFYLVNETAGAPDLSDNYVRFGWAADSGSNYQLFPQLLQKSGGATYAVNGPAGLGVDGEWIFVRLSGGACRAYYKTANGLWIEFDVESGFGVTGGSPMYALYTLGTGTEDRLIPSSVDYFRMSDDSNIYTP